MSQEIYYDNNVYNSGEESFTGSEKKGFAITALVLGIVSVLCCCCGLSVIAAPLAIIFAVVALVKKQGGTAMSVVGLVLAAISLIATIVIGVTYGPIFNDAMKFAQNADAVVAEYEETGELPDYLEKYTAPEYDEVWESSGYDDFYGFFEAYITEMRVSGLIEGSGGVTDNASDDESIDE